MSTSDLPVVALLRRLVATYEAVEDGEYDGGIMQAARDWLAANDSMAAALRTVGRTEIDASRDTDPLRKDILQAMAAHLPELALRVAAYDGRQADVDTLAFGLVMASDLAAAEALQMTGLAGYYPALEIAHRDIADNLKRAQAMAAKARGALQ